jgi:hypothetical protein
MPLYLNQSAACGAFKGLIGNANHLVITAMVGLDAIERGIVTKIPKDLHAAWTPIDAVASARRSRRMLLDMALVRSVDSLDVYLRHSLRKPCLIQSDVLRTEIDKAKLSIFRKFLALENHHPDIDPVACSIVSLMIAWRNRAAHAEADEDVPERHKQIIRVNADAIATRFRGLNSEILLSGFDVDRAHHFKEIASFINATNHFVEDVERVLFGRLDARVFLKDLVWTAVSQHTKPEGDIDQIRKKHLRSIWGKDPSEKNKSVERFLQHYGLSKLKVTKKDRAMPSVVFSDDILAELVAMTPTEVFGWAQSL